MHKKKYIAIAVLAFLGIINALYLSYEAYQIVFAQNLGTTFCDFNEQASCSGFLNNPRSRIFGIPFPMIAAIVYPVLFVLSLFAIKTKSRAIVTTIFVMALMGLSFNGYVISQEFIVGVFCPLCMMCTGYIFTIAILSGLILKGNCSCCKKEKTEK